MPLHSQHSDEATTLPAIQVDVSATRIYYSINSIPKDFPYLLPHLSMQPRIPPPRDKHDKQAQTISLIRGAFSSIPHARLLLERLAGQDGTYRDGKLPVKHSQMRHPWSLQALELFAESVVVWIE